MPGTFEINNAQPLAAAYAVLALHPEPSASAAVAPPAPIAGKGYYLIKNWNFGTEAGRNMSDATSLAVDFHPLLIYAGETLDHLGSSWHRYAASFGTGVNHVFNSDNIALVATLTSLSSGAIQSGMMRSRYSAGGTNVIGGAFEHGYFEARLKTPDGTGLLPAFWLNPQSGWPPEIDILEIPSNGSNHTTLEARFNLHGPGFPGNTNYYNPNYVTNVSQVGSAAYHFSASAETSYNIWGLEWTPTECTWFVNDTKMLSRPFQWLWSASAIAETDAHLAHVLLTLDVGSAVGGSDWPGDPQSANAFPATMNVDYCRVWVKSPQYILRTVAGAGTGSGTHAWPTGHQTHDVALFVFETNKEDTVSLTTAAGFERLLEIDSGPDTSGNTATKLTLFWARASSDAMPTPAFADPGDHYNNGMYVWRNVKQTGNPFTVLNTSGIPVTSTPLSVRISEGDDPPQNTQVICVLGYHLDTQTKVLSSVTCTSVQLFNVGELREEAWDSGSGGGFGIFTGQADGPAVLNVDAVPLRGGVGGISGRSSRSVPHAPPDPHRADEDYWEARERYLRARAQRTRQTP